MGGGAVGGRAAKTWGGLLAVGVVSVAIAADPPAFPAFDPARLAVTTQRPDAAPAPTPPVPPPLPDRSTPFAEPPLARPPQPPAPPTTPPSATTANQLPLTPGGTAAPGTASVAPGEGGRQRIRFGPRYSVPPSFRLLPDESDADKERTRSLITGGVIVNIETLGAGAAQNVEIAADSAVAWVRRPNRDIAPAGPGTPIEAEAGKTEVELYLAGNVVIRTVTIDGRGVATPETINAAEAYYDASRNKGVFRDATIDLSVPGLTDPVRLEGLEMDQLGKNHFEIYEARIAASKRPSDPGLNFRAKRSVFTREFTTRTNLFGIPYRNLTTGQPDVGFEQILTSYNVTPRVFDVPFFYLPRTRNDIREPFGPLVGFATANNRLFGYQLYSTFDMFKLLALRGPPNHRWLLYGDYYGDRGPAIGTSYEYNGADMFGLAPRDANGNKALGGFNQPFTGQFRAYLVNDTKKNRLGVDALGNPIDPRLPNAVDILGGDRGLEPIPPGYRSRIGFLHNQDFYENGTTYVRGMAQAQYFSDKNFYEQYYKPQFDLLPNQETFAYLQAAAGNVGGSFLVQGDLQRPWITQTEWLPKADAHLIGESLFGLLTYSSRASAGYAQLKPATVEPFPVTFTDRAVETGRFNWNQRLEAPLDVGPVRITPYGVVDLTSYTADLSGYGPLPPDRFAAGRGPLGIPGPPLPPEFDSESRGRFYGGGGAEASMNLSRLYPEASSELFNVTGLNHKITLRGNYFNAYSDTPYYQLPQLDRLNDDATDQGYRTTRPRQFGLIQNSGQFLSESPLFDPQQYAIRRLVENRVDTLDSIEVVQLGVDQRLQTKRGFPGAQHTVDWMTLNLSASFFPNHERDNYGQTGAFYEYYFLWHLGDRMSLSSAGWMDPIENGPRYFNAGVNFGRPDGTNVYFSYRHTDPLRSRAVTAVINYNLNRKYSVNVITTYDFGLNAALSNTVALARVGADVTTLFGFSYNALQNNFGLQIALVPNLLGLSGARLTQAPIFGPR